MTRTVPFAITLHIRDTCLCLHTQRAVRVLARQFDRAFQPLGLTNQQFSLMMALNRPEPPTLSALAAFLAVDRTTLTAALKPLERRGLVAALPNRADRRSKLLRLTPEGEALLRHAVPIWKRAHAKLEAALPSSPDALRRALDALAHSEETEVPEHAHAAGPALALGA